MHKLENDSTQKKLKMEPEILSGTRTRNPLTGPDLDFDHSLSLDLNLAGQNFLIAITQLFFKLGT